MLDRVFGKKCRMCRRRGARLIGDVKPTHPARFHTDIFHLWCCPDCEVVYLDPAPTAGDLDALYRDSVQFSDAHYTDPEQVAKILDYYGTAVRNLQLLPRDGARVLEIGAGLAWVSRACKDADHGATTIAQDVSTECSAHCPWVDRYFIGELHALDDEQPFDLVSMTHVIEHLVDPAAMLAQVSNRLAPGGKLFVTAPFRPVGWTASQGIEPWRGYSYLHVPAHVSYLSRKWFEQMAERHDLTIISWDAGHEDGQAFELVMQRL